MLGDDWNILFEICLECMDLQHILKMPHTYAQEVSTLLLVVTGFSEFDGIHI